jgi:hypothetical protein
MEIPGHAQISTTMNIYTHIAPESQRETTERVADRLWLELRNGLVSNPTLKVAIDPH